MSADRWTICPQCEKMLADEKVALLDKIQRSYGKVSEDEYQELLIELENLKQKPRRTLREDWELGVREGVFSVKYYAECSKCGFSKVFEHREVIEL